MFPSCLNSWKFGRLYSLEKHVAMLSPEGTELLLCFPRTRNQSVCLFDASVERRPSVKVRLGEGWYTISAEILANTNYCFMKIEASQKRSLWPS